MGTVRARREIEGAALIPLKHRLKKHGVNEAESTYMDL